MERKQVIIVGGGPVGVALAVQLGMRGIGCALVESRTELGRIPKGQNLTHRTLEHFYFMGIVDELRAARFMPPGFAIGEITSYGDLNGRVLVRAGGPRAGPRLLLPEERPAAAVPDGKGAAGQDGDPAERREPLRLDRHQGRAGRAAARASPSPGTARARCWRAIIVVGCDGGHSIVREQIGIPRSGHDFDQLMVLIVFRSRELHDELGKRFPPKSTYRAMHPDLKGYWKFFGRIDVGEGFFFHAPVPKDTTRDNFDFQGLLHEATGFPFDGRVRPRRVLGPARRGRREIPGRARVHRRRRRAQPSALWRLRPQQRAGGRGQSRLEARGASSTAGAATRCCILQRRAAADLQGGGGGFHRRAHPERWRVPQPLQSGARQGGVRDGVEGAGERRRQPRAGLRAELRRLAGGDRPAGRRLHRARPARVQGAGRAPSGAAEAHRPAATCSRSWGAASRCWRSTWTTRRCGRSSRRRATLKVPLKVVRDSYADGRTKYETRMILVRPDQFIVWIGDSAPADAGADHAQGRRAGLDHG